MVKGGLGWLYFCTGYFSGCPPALLQLGKLHNTWLRTRFWLSAQPGTSTQWTVPQCAQTMRFVITGGAGGQIGYQGGYGALISGSITVSPGQTISAVAGSAGGINTAGISAYGNGEPPPREVVEAVQRLPCILVVYWSPSLEEVGADLLQLEHIPTVKHISLTVTAATARLQECRGLLHRLELTWLIISPRRPEEARARPAALASGAILRIRNHGLCWETWEWDCWRSWRRQSPNDFKRRWRFGWWGRRLQGRRWWASVYLELRRWLVCHSGGRRRRF